MRTGSSPVARTNPYQLEDQPMFTSECEMDLAEWLAWSEWCQTQPNCAATAGYCYALAAIATL